MQRKKRALTRTLVVLTALVLVMSGMASALACTSIYFGKDTTDSGSYFWGRSEDINAAFGKLFNVQEAEEHEPGDMYISGTWNSAYTTFTPKFRWPYPEKTLRYTYCADSLYNEREASQPYAEVGTNEKGVSISATVTLSTIKPVLRTADPSVSRNNGGLAEIDVATVVLMQAETARDACELLGEIITTVGASGAEGLMISDPNEVWFFQWLLGHQYVAVKCPDDMVGISPNTTVNVGDKDGYVDITDTENVIVSPGFVSIPKAAGVLVAKDGDTKVKVADTYANATANHWASRLQTGFGYLYGLTTNAQLQAAIPTQNKFLDYFHAPRQTGGKYSLYEAMRMLAARGVDTEWEGASSIGSNSCVEAHIFENRPNMIPELATIKWLAMAPAEYSVYLPYFGNLVTEVFEKNYSPDAGRNAPAPIKTGYDSADPDNNSMYWVFRELHTQCAVSNLTERARLGNGVKDFWARYQKSLIAQQSAVDAAMLELFAFDPELATVAATEISKAVSEETYEYAKAILAELKAFKTGSTTGNFVSALMANEDALPTYAALVAPYLATRDTQLEDALLALSVAVEAYQNCDKPEDWSTNTYINALALLEADVALKSDINTTTETLNDLTALLPKVVSIKEMLGFYAECLPNQYNAGSYIPFVVAAQCAEAVYANADATPEEIYTAWNDLDAAKSALDESDAPYLRLNAAQLSTIALKVGQTCELLIDTNTMVLYLSSAPATVSVSQTGLLTGLKAGISVVTVRSLLDPSQVLSIVVNCTK